MTPSALRKQSLLFLLIVLLSACGQSGLSLEEYGTQAEALVIQTTVRIDSLDAELEASADTPERARSYWADRLDARAEFLDGLESLDPPDEIAELHKIVLDLFVRLNAAEQAMADRVTLLEPGLTTSEGWATPEGREAKRVDEEVDSICHVAQAEFDKTASRSAFADTPWIPSEMKEVVRVAFGCPA